MDRTVDIIRHEEMLPLLHKLIELQLEIRDKSSDCIKIYLEYQVKRVRNIVMYYTMNLSQIKQSWKRLDTELDLLHTEYLKTWYIINKLLSDLPYEECKNQLKYMKQSEKFFSKGNNKLKLEKLMEEENIWI